MVGFNPTNSGQMEKYRRKKIWRANPRCDRAKAKTGTTKRGYFYTDGRKWALKTAGYPRPSAPISVKNKTIVPPTTGLSAAHDNPSLRP
jgi:hypothetical protein